MKYNVLNDFDKIFDVILNHPEKVDWQAYEIEDRGAVLLLLYVLDGSNFIQYKSVIMELFDFGDDNERIPEGYTVTNDTLRFFSGGWTIDRKPFVYSCLASQTDLTAGKASALYASLGNLSLNLFKKWQEMDTGQRLQKMLPVNLPVSKETVIVV